MTSISTTATASAKASPKYGHLFFEHLWRSSGIQGVAFIVVGALLAGFGPQVGASPDSVASFYAANSVRLLIATPILGLGVLNLVWFMQSIRVALAEAGLDGWGAAGTAASAMTGATLFILIAIQGVLAYAIAGTGSSALTSGLSALVAGGWVLSSLPRAMFVMAGTFGFWRAGYITNTQFVVGVGLVILGVLGATTWIAGTIWAPDAAFSRIILPALELVWVVAIGRVLNRVPSTKTGF
jgi:hypothetical protein